MGIINLDSPVAKEIGFTADLFDGYLWEDSGFVWISFIASKQSGQGNFRALLDRIEKKWGRVVVPTPSLRMVKILTRRGYRYVQFWAKELGKYGEALAFGFPEGTIIGESEIDGGDTKEEGE